MEKEKKKEAKVVMQDLYTKLGTPGTPHKLLSRMAGSWAAKVKSWMEPDKPPMESAGSSERKMLFDGRYLQEEFTGEMMGSPFNGLGFTGYDNNAKKYVSTWMDSMSTGILFFEGTAGADGNAITQKSSYSDPFRGPAEWRSVIRFLDEDTEIFEMYNTVRGGKEEKMMEITYTRKR